MTTRSMLLLQLVGCGVFFQAVPGALPDALAQQTAAIEQSDSPADAANPQASLLNVELPDSPGAVVSKLHQSTAQQDAAGQVPNTQASTQPEDQPAQPPTPPPTQKPVGTAAAGFIPTSGVAASQPAGVAIAPAKQHRVRTMVIRMGALIGAGVAVGSVVALTEATPSKPPGAH